MRYAGLDLYPSVLLYRHIMERVDSVVTLSRLDVRTLAVGTSVRLYTRRNSRVVAVGIVVHSSARRPGLSKWENAFFLVRHEATDIRMLVKLNIIHVPGVMASYLGEVGKEAQAQNILGVGTEVLGDAVSSYFVW